LVCEFTGWSLQKSPLAYIVQSALGVVKAIPLSIPIWMIVLAISTMRTIQDRLFSFSAKLKVSSQHCAPPASYNFQVLVTQMQKQSNQRRGTAFLKVSFLLGAFTAKSSQQVREVTNFSFQSICACQM
jgi:hypothetical protein